MLSWRTCTRDAYQKGAKSGLRVESELNGIWWESTDAISIEIYIESSLQLQGCILSAEVMDMAKGTYHAIVI